MPQKREQWRLPKTFKRSKAAGGRIQRHDGEPRFYELVKHEGDNTLLIDTYIECCDCGLIHHHTFNVLKTRDGNWYLVHRAYRVPKKE